MKFNELSNFRNNYIGFVFQSFYLLIWYAKQVGRESINDYLPTPFIK